MNQDIARLQELLTRVQRNAALPRFVESAPLLAAAPPGSPGAAPSSPIAAHASSPAASPSAPYAAPLPTPPAAPRSAPAASPSPSTPYASTPYAIPPGSTPYAAPPPSTPYAIPPASTPYAIPAGSTPYAAPPLDASVDELLLEDPFPSVPPPAPPARPRNEDEQTARVSISVSRLAELAEDVSGVISVGDLSEAPPEELLEDDIVDMTGTESAAPPPQHSLDELNFDDDEHRAAAGDDEPPSSSSRSKVAGSLDEALARAAAQVDLEEGREVPLKTPPPESGPQAATALPVGMQAPLPPDIEDLLEADIQPKGGVHSAVPTAEQLGQTIELEEARGPSLELDHPPAFVPEPLQEDLSSEELEVTLPGREFVGGYQHDLLPPPEAQQELEAHRQRLGEAEAVPPPPESLAQLPSLQPAAASGGFSSSLAATSVTTDSYAEAVSTVTVDAPPNAEFAPELLARPEQSPSTVAKFIRVSAPRPNTFLELLDASLSLGRD